MSPTRRAFLAAGAAGLASGLFGRAQGMSLHLSCSAIGVKASQPEAIDYAARFGFDSVDADGRYRSIEISSLKKDLQVRARKGYFAPQDK